jgi:hypothetical protein
MPVSTRFRRCFFVRNLLWPACALPTHSPRTQEQFMTPNRFAMAAAILAVLAIALPAPAAAPEGGKSKTHAAKGHYSTQGKLIEKGYQVADLLHQPDQGEPLVKVIVRAVEPNSWAEKGGRATIDFHPLTMAIVVKQTAEGHKQIATVLRALRIVCNDENTSTARITPTVYSTDSEKTTQPPCKPAAQALPKQYGHVVLDNVRLNAMGVSCSVKRIRLMYKGDGPITEAVKTAVANGDGDKTQQAAAVLGALLEEMGLGSRSCSSMHVPYSSGPFVSCPSPTTSAGMSCSSSSMSSTSSSSAPTSSTCMPSTNLASPTLSSGCSSTYISAEKKDEKGKQLKAEKND